MEPLEQVIEPVSAPERRVAAGGWRRGAVGIALGIAAGALVAAVTPRDADGRPARTAGPARTARSARTDGTARSSGTGRTALRRRER